MISCTLWDVTWLDADETLEHCLINESELQELADAGKGTLIVPLSMISLAPIVGKSDVSQTLDAASML